MIAYLMNQQFPEIFQITFIFGCCILQLNLNQFLKAFFKNLFIPISQFLKMSDHNLYFLQGVFGAIDDMVNDEWCMVNQG